MENEQKPKTSNTIRPTKKQRELLVFLEGFIAEHGYSPSYREIMNGCNYSSVATVALHINNLIRRGHLRKRDRSARSLEVVSGSDATVVTETATVPKTAVSIEQNWLTTQTEKLLKKLETAERIDTLQFHKTQHLIHTLSILGMQAEATLFSKRLLLATVPIDRNDSDQ